MTFQNLSNYNRSLHIVEEIPYRGEVSQQTVPDDESQYKLTPRSRNDPSLTQHMRRCMAAEVIRETENRKQPLHKPRKNR